MRKTILMFLLAALLAGGALAGEKKLMHCFYFTPIDTATEADWQAFHKATDGLVDKIPGVTRVWYGKLRSPMAQFGADAAARKELSAGAQSAKGEVTRRVRSHGVCMEMSDEAALKVYADHPAHKEWEAVYSKVRQPGTMTFDLLGQ